ncbi:hypothetical protein [Bythopirellula polymerisocia]|uniref:PEP-CTERM protein-sorting domain-containing protein n=1 Tax=Bythopirellula polymerisocia TaxID=2528003 RepID=A0A5C6CQK1_9BACT|nr:hypothetical protein [Bythopirellula polymerisocia]TWU25857.1 hypothetical protein Pla144_30700 [Bythopirellula polymerisocia]
MRSSCLCALVILLFQISQCSADLVVGWDVFDLTSWGPSPFAPTQSSLDLSGTTGITRGSGVTTSGTASSNAWGGNGFDTTSLANSLTASDFVSFSFTVGSGTSLSLTNIAPYNIRRSSTGPSLGQWQYQLGMGSWTSIGSAINWGSTTSSNGNLQSAIDLTSILDLQNVSSGTKVSFRVANWSGATSGTWYFNNFFTGSTAYPNDLQVNGTFATVPEPSAFLFGGLITTVLGAGYVRRRLQQWGLLSGRKTLKIRQEEITLGSTGS